MTQSPMEVMKEVARAGYCRHPIRIYGETVDVATGEIRPSDLRIPCKDRRAAICPSCAYLYKADAWILASTGLIGGKGLPGSVATHPRIFVTLTAPSFGEVHTVTDSGACHPRPRRCVHGVGPCRRRHGEGAAELGSPLCKACFDYEGAVLWNAFASKLWNRTIDRLRHRLATSQGLSEASFRRCAEVSYLRIAEFQRRGLVHFHIVLRADGSEGPGSAPPDWLDVELLAVTLLEVTSEVVVRSPHGRRVEWGSQRDVIDLSGSAEAPRVAAYVAKYATKTSDGSFGLAYRFRDRFEVMHAPIDDHHRRLALMAWDLGERSNLDELHLRSHAHTFGFGGQLLTKSRTYSTTFGALRGARTAFMARQQESVPIDGSFLYAGRGYSDPRGESVAELLHGLVVEVHAEGKQHRIDAGGANGGGAADRCA